MPRSYQPRGQRPMPPPEPGASPIGDLPPLIVVLALGLGLVEIALSLGNAGLVGGPYAVGWRVSLIERLGMSPAAWEAMGRQGLFADPGLSLRLVAYPVVHAGAIQTLFACAMLLALGKFVAEAMGQARTAVVLLVATLAGAVAHGVLRSGTLPLYGAFPPVYGLIGAYTYLLWARIGAAGGHRLGAFRLIGVLLGLQLVFGALFGANPLWVGDLGGFVGGGVAAVFLAPGSWPALRERLRAR